MPVTLTKIPNPLQPEINKKEILDFIPGGSLHQYLADLPLHDDRIEFVVALNGKVVSRPHHEVHVFDGDIISVCAKTKATVAGVVAAAVAGISTNAGFFGTLSVLANAGAYGTALVYGATYIGAMVAIGYGMQKLASALGPDPVSSSDSSSTTHYTWGNPQQTTAEGVNIPYLFGTNKVYGQIINQFVTFDGDKETLNVLMGICDHEVDSITDVRISDQPYIYYKDVTVYTDRIGALTDEPIPGFSEIVGQNDVGIKLVKDVQVTQQTDGTAVEKLNIIITAPSGLYYSNDSGGFDSRSATFTVEYKAIDDTEYIVYSTETMSGATTETQRSIITIDDLTPGQYEVRITRTNESVDSYRGNSDIYFTCLQEIIKYELSYPGLAKYAVQALATDQLSGSVPTFSCLATRSMLYIYDEDNETWGYKRATDPAWICYYLLVEYAGIDKDRLIWDDFKAWSDYCSEAVDDEYRFIVNTIIYEGNFWEQIQKVARMGHAVIIRRGSYYGVFVDKEDDIESHLFTMGNIIEGSFSIQYLPKKDRADAIEIQYTDPDRDYTTQIVTVYSDSYINGDDVAQKTSVTIEAAIPQAQAVREGVFRINSNKYLVRTITFDAFVDSFGCVIGDVFLFQHEILNFENSNTSGRIISADNDDGAGSPYVKLDQEVEIKTGIAYRILVRLVNASGQEEYIEKIVNNAAGTTDTLSLTSAWTTVPDDQAVFVFGTADTYKKPYRIVSIDRKDDFTRTMTGLEYISEIYTETGGVIEEPPWENPKQEAIQVLLYEFLAYATDGSYESNVQVSWHSSHSNTGGNWAIWYEDVTAGTSPKKLADVYVNNYTIDTSLVIGNTYRVYVVVSGEGPVDTGNNTAEITIQGKLAPPSDVTGFVGQWDALHRAIHFSWSHVNDIDLDYYEIRQGPEWVVTSSCELTLNLCNESLGIIDEEVFVQGCYGIDDPSEISGITPQEGDIFIKTTSSMENDLKVARTSDNTVSIYIDEGVSESRTYRIKAFDTSGIESENEDVCVVAIDTSDCKLAVPGALQVTSSSTIGPDGTDMIVMIATWNADAEISDDFHHYELQVENMATGAKAEYGTTDRTYTWENVLANTQYAIIVRAVDVSGNETAWSAVVLHTTCKDEEPPSVPTGLSALGTWSSIILRWEHGAENDLDHFVIYRNTSDDSATAEELATAVKSYISTVAMFTDTPPDSATYYYWIKAVDTSGNESDFSDSASADAPGVLWEDIDVPEQAITTTMIADNAIETPKLAANAVTANEIAAGAVLAESIAANAILAAHINAGEIGTDHLAAESVDATKMAVEALSAITANMGTLTTGLIQNADGSMSINLNNNSFNLGDKLTWDGIALTISGWNPSTDTTTIDGGKVWAGSCITIGNMDGVSDFVQISSNGIITYRYFNATIGHQPVKSLKRIEYGYCESGVTVTLPGYWAKQPIIHVSPRTIKTYVNAHSDYDQQIECPNPVSYEVSTGVWAFNAVAQLILSDGAGGQNIGYSATTDTTEHSSVFYATPAEYSISEASTESVKAFVSLSGFYEQYWNQWTIRHSILVILQIRYKTGGAWSDWTGDDTYWVDENKTSADISVTSGTAITDVQVRAVWYWDDDYIASDYYDYHWPAEPPVSNISCTLESYESTLSGFTEIATGTLNYIAIEPSGDIADAGLVGSKPLDLLLCDESLSVMDEPVIIEGYAYTDDPSYHTGLLPVEGDIFIKYTN
ncbi:host specificity factor TipJ family phage tail protein [Desulfobacula phenolica]|uniref:Phage-related protein, tail component n=1 Tax=Desulfobacula phenolica TaxID=90732 RepID=A0A1H2H3X8_9BACT|nr:host specificity factor TipJ family phage tail protein [Desulfobacula phenolica]SDU26526.1 Phage-related protein, tail component [Desulfobacula phenolica]